MKNHVFLKPDHVFLKVGTNDLASENNAERIAKSIVDLAKKFFVKDHCSVSISRIVPRNDNLNTKAERVNVFLRIMCSHLQIYQHYKAT